MTLRRRNFTSLAIAAAWLAVVWPASAQQLIIWHDKGDDGIRMIQ